MTATRPERPVVLVTDDTTRDDLIETVRLLNDNAKRIHRRGYIGVASPAYEREHQRINELLAEIEAKA